MAKRKNKIDFEKLFFSIILDVIGYFTYVVPGVGESADIVWSPVYMVILNKMYNNDIYTLSGGLEELLPFTDFIPSATIFWFIETFK